MFNTPRCPIITSSYDFILIINDNAYGTIKNVQMDHFGKTIGVELDNPDFMKFAESFGIHGLRVSNLHNLKPALENALSLKKPVILEVLVEKSFKGKIYETIKKAGNYIKSVS